MTDNWRDTPRPIGVTEHGDVVFPLRTEAVVAQELRDEIAPHLTAICQIMDKARAAGFTLNFNIAPDQFGRHRAPEVSIVKPL